MFTSNDSSDCVKKSFSVLSSENGRIPTMGVLESFYQLFLRRISNWSKVYPLTKAMHDAKKIPNRFSRNTVS